MTSPSDRLSSRHSSARAILLIAACCALASGLLEGTVFCIIRAVPGWITWQMRLTNVSSEILWIAPLVDLVLFTFLACGVAVATAWAGRFAFARRIAPETIAVFLFSWAALYPVISTTGRMLAWAAWLLSLGMATQIARWFHRREPAALTVFRRSLVPLLITVAAAAGATTGWDKLREASLMRRLPPPTRAPNVLLIVLDTLRADHLSDYGYQRSTTPNLDKFAQDGVLFENTFALSSWTVPSHASLVTGRFVHEHGADSARPVLGPEYPTLAEVMAAHGYLTAGFSANTWWITRNSGFDRGFVHFEDYFESVADAVARTAYGKELYADVLLRLGYRDNLGRRRAGDVNAAFLHWLDANDRRPFFVFLNFVEVHAPYLSPAPYHTRFMDDAERARERRFAFRPPMTANGSPRDGSLLTAGYDGSLAFLDAELAKLFDALQARGMLDNTLVVLTSDHGEALGDHGLFQHGHSLYRDQIQVPLVLRLPGTVPQGLRISQPVSLRGIAATITALVFPDSAPLFPGSSLATLWSGSGAQTGVAREAILSEVSTREGVPKAWPISQGWVRSLIADNWHFIVQENGEEALYDWRNDRQESDNLAKTPAGMAVVQDLRQQMASMRGYSGAADGSQPANRGVVVGSTASAVDATAAGRADD